MNHIRRAFALTAATAMAALIAVAASACGGTTTTSRAATTSGTATNGLENKSPADVLQAAAAALAAAKSVHIVGTRPGVRFDARVQGDSSTGTITKGGVHFRFTKIGNDFYFETDQAGLKKLGAPLAVQQLGADRWFKGDDSQHITSGLTIADLASQLTAHHGDLVPIVRQATINGSKVVVISAVNGSKLYIANTGPAYPLHAEGKGQSTGVTDFTEYNAPLHITAPPNAVDIGNAS
jgi:hypothetical protein